MLKFAGQIEANRVLRLITIQSKSRGDGANFGEDDDTLMLQRDAVHLRTQPSVFMSRPVRRGSPARNMNKISILVVKMMVSSFKTPFGMLASSGRGNPHLMGRILCFKSFLATC